MLGEVVHNDGPPIHNLREASFFVTSGLVARRREESRRGTLKRVPHQLRQDAIFVAA